MRYDLLLMVVLLLPIATRAFGDGWTLLRSRDGVDTFVHDRIEDGLKEVRGVATLAVTFEEASDVITDIPGNVHWLPSCKGSELIRTISSRVEIFHTPWMGWTFSAPPALEWRARS